MMTAIHGGDTDTSIMEDRTPSLSGPLGGAVSDVTTHHMNAALSPTVRSKSRGTTAFCLLLTLALLLGALPYRGPRHDGILYFGQALSHLNLRWSAADLFFAHGSQDQFSIFSRLVAALLRQFDAAAVDMTLLCGAWVAWLVALLALVRDFPARERWAAVVAVISAAHYYGGSRMFGYMEPFVTARTWAEPVALLALVALLRGRLWMALSAFLLSMALHPLVALPVGAVALTYLVMLDRRWAALLLLAIPVLGAAFAGVAPFAGLLNTYDPEWFQATLLANDLVYVSNWNLPDFVAPLVWMGVLWMAHRGSTTPFARLARAAVITTPILFLTAFVGADLMHNVLVTQLQLWRVSWILDLLALASLPALLLREWFKGPKGRCAAIAVFVAVYAADDWISTAWLLAAWALAALVLSASRAEAKPSLLRVVSAATVLAALGVIILQWLNAKEQLNMHAQSMKAAQPFSVIFGMPLLTLPVALGLTLLWHRGGAARVLASMITLGLLGAVALNWDQRTPWIRYVESARPGAHPFDAFIPPDAQVYWHEDVLAEWVLLQRANFISNNQTSGLLFNRATALEAAQRIPPYLNVMAGTQKCARLEALGAVALDRGVCDLPRDSFLGLCHVRPTPPDFLVASTDFGMGVVARWQFAPSDGSAPTTYALYDCHKVP